VSLQAQVPSFGLFSLNSGRPSPIYGFDRPRRAKLGENWPVARKAHVHLGASIRY